MEQDSLLDEIGFVSGAGEEKWGEVLKEKFNLSLDDLKTPIANWLKENAQTLSLELMNISPFGDYSKVLEDNESMAQFLQTECIKTEHWKLDSVRQYGKNMLQFLLTCSAVDEGDSLKGSVFVSKSGKIKHAFVQDHS